MADSAPVKLRIKLNLLHPQGSSQRLAEKFFKWLISYGRFIVIAVEAVVIGAFIMRFSLDAKLDELKNRINDDVPYVTKLAQDESLIRQTQLRLKTIGETYKDSQKWSEILSDLTAKLPERVIFINLNIQKDAMTNSLQFRLSAKTNLHTYLSQYLNNLKSDPKFKDILLANVSYDQGELLFIITGTKAK